SLTYTLPRLVGQQNANLLFYTGRRVPGDEAVAMGMADVLVPLDEVRTAATALATEIAQSAPLAVQSTRETMRRGFADGAERATERELTEQEWTRKTADFKEGVKAWAERRLPALEGRWARAGAAVRRGGDRGGGATCRRAACSCRRSSRRPGPPSSDR